jgi:hypothetical protein
MSLPICTAHKTRRADCTLSHALSRPNFDASWFYFAAISVFSTAQNWEPGTKNASQVIAMSSAQPMPNLKPLIRQLLQSGANGCVV